MRLHIRGPHRRSASIPISTLVQSVRLTGRPVPPPASPALRMSLVEGIRKIVSQRTKMVAQRRARKSDAKRDPLRQKSLREGERSCGEANHVSSRRPISLFCALVDHQFVSPKERLLTRRPQVSASPISPCSSHYTGAPKIRAHARGHQALPRDSESFPRESIPRDPSGRQRICLHSP
jgi:hypothetical protein